MNTPASRRVPVYILIIVIGTLGITLCIFEIATRILWHGDTSQQSVASHPTFPLTREDTLGWIQTPNYHWAGTKYDASGTAYHVEISVDAHGFRRFHATPGPRTRTLLVIGDSFTQAVDVSNNHTYYGLLSHSLPLDVFAYGAGGYGTLQEYLIVDRSIDDILPDIVVLQVCSNDFINNSSALERLSTQNNNGKWRPYYTEHGIVYTLPTVTRYSRFLSFLIPRLHKLSARYAQESIETRIEHHPTLPLFIQSVNVTARLLSMIAARIPASTAIYMFSSDTQEPFYRTFMKLSAQSRITFLADIPNALETAAQQGVTIHAGDHAHWNNAGHQIVAETLKPYLHAELTLQNSQSPL